MQKQRIKYILPLLTLLLLAACTPSVHDAQQKDTLPQIYPDYTDITVPCNIAPLNFMFTDENVDAVSLVLTCENESYTLTKRGKKLVIPIKDWKEWTKRNKGKSTKVQTFARINDTWMKYQSFTWDIVSDEIDAYITYRLIEPGFEVWNALQIEERCIENFNSKILADNSMMEKRCMNCHIHGGDKGQFSFFYLRGKGGGTILNRGKELRKVTLKNDQMNGSTVYGDFHPSGKFGVYSTNVIMPAFHSMDSKRLEVYDSNSDLCIADFENNRMILSPLTTDSTKFETFPTFSADGKKIYFCSSEISTPLPTKVENLHYSLCSIDFDEEKGEWGTQVDTLYNARIHGGSANFPKASPDGKYILFTHSDYGTFPIWHKEADLYLLNLQTGTMKNLTETNSNRSDTYHSWSGNSRWFAFASKREDGQYGRVYFAYLNKEGKSHKAFVLPQKDPEKDFLNLKSYNIPDLSATSMPYNAKMIEKINRERQAEIFN